MAYIVDCLAHVGVAGGRAAAGRVRGRRGRCVRRRGGDGSQAYRQREQLYCPHVPRVFALLLSLLKWFVNSFFNNDCRSSATEKCVTELGYYRCRRFVSAPPRRRSVPLRARVHCMSFDLLHASTASISRSPTTQWRSTYQDRESPPSAPPTTPCPRYPFGVPAPILSGPGRASLPRPFLLHTLHPAMPFPCARATRLHRRDIHLV